MVTFISDTKDLSIFAYAITQQRIKVKQYEKYLKYNGNFWKTNNKKVGMLSFLNRCCLKKSYLHNQQEKTKK